MNEELQAGEKCAHRKLLLPWLMQQLQHMHLCHTRQLPRLPHLLQLETESRILSPWCTCDKFWSKATLSDTCKYTRRPAFWMRD